MTSIHRPHSNNNNPDNVVELKRRPAAKTVTGGYTPDTLEEISWALGVDWRYNTRAKRREIRSHHTNRKWAPLTDRIRDDFLAAAGKQYEWTNTRGRQTWDPPDTKFERMLNSVMFRNETDPFIEWLETEVAGHMNSDRFDEQSPLTEEWLINLFGVEDTELNRWAAKYAPLAAIWRAYQPGCQLRQFPVLIGKQGLGKSQAVKHLFPPEHEEWYGDELNFYATPKEQAEAMAGKVIVEIAEMIGSRKADRERMKAFLTRTDDGQHRAAYARGPEPNPRRCCFVATSNDPECLPDDPTGNTRFVVIRLGDTAAEAAETYMAEHRLDIWAGALLLYRLGVGAQLPRHLFPQQAEINEQHRSKNFVLEDAVDRLEYEQGTITQLMERVNVEERWHVKFAELLKQNGWHKERKRVDGKPVTLWFPPCTPTKQSSKHDTLGEF